MVIDTDDLLSIVGSKAAFVTANWKTTVSGILSAALACITAYAALPPGLAKPVYVIAVIHALIGFLQKDAGKALAKPHGASTPVSVPSHEVPDDPSAIPIAEAK